MDARVRNTRQKIRTSLIALLRQKPIHQVTVKEICELAEINRATFYGHYNNPKDLLEKTEIDFFMSCFDKALISSLPQEDAVEKMTNLIFGVMRDNRELCEVLFSDNGDRLFLHRLMEKFRPYLISQLEQRYPEVPAERLTHLYVFATGGSLSLLEDWIRNGMPEPQPPVVKISAALETFWLSQTENLAT